MLQLDRLGYCWLGWLGVIGHVLYDNDDVIDTRADKYVLKKSNC